jgi:hypothetical protein
MIFQGGGADEGENKSTLKSELISNEYRNTIAFVNLQLAATYRGIFHIQTRNTTI